MKIPTRSLYSPESMELGSPARLNMAQLINPLLEKDLIQGWVLSPARLKVELLPEMLKNALIRSSAREGPSPLASAALSH